MPERVKALLIVKGDVVRGARMCSVIRQKLVIRSKRVLTTNGELKRWSWLQRVLGTRSVRERTITVSYSVDLAWNEKVVWMGHQNIN